MGKACCLITSIVAAFIVLCLFLIAMQRGARLQVALRVLYSCCTLSTGVTEKGQACCLITSIAASFIVL